MNETITAVPGVKVGHWTHEAAMTGCTVIDLPEPNVVAGEVRGGAPGSREMSLLEAGKTVQEAQAILLTGGSAFGLAAADGVMRCLEEDGRGYDTVVARVPIVPTAVIFDLGVGEPNVRPGPSEGAIAFRAATASPVELGRVGAGTGATVSKWRGLDAVMPGGLGSAVQLVGTVAVGALVVVNAIGDVFTLDGQSLTGGGHEPGPPTFEETATSNTTLAVIAIDAALSRVELGRLIVRAHDALGTCLRPAHTKYDGDVVFAVSVGEKEADADALGEAAYVAVGRAIHSAVVAAGTKAS